MILYPHWKTCYNGLSGLHVRLCVQCLKFEVSEGFLEWLHHFSKFSLMFFFFKTPNNIFLDWGFWIGSVGANFSPEGRGQPLLLSKPTEQ